MSKEEIIKQTQIYIDFLTQERKNEIANIEQISFQKTDEAKELLGEE